MLAALAAYAFAWIEVRGRDVLFIAIFALQIVPLQMALVPLLQMFSRARARRHDVIAVIPGRTTQVWIAHTIFALPLGDLPAAQLHLRDPERVIEAARVDGASHGQIFFRDRAAAVVPALASFAIFQFLWVWNDLLVALIFAGGTQDVAPLTAATGRAHRQPRAGLAAA